MLLTCGVYGNVICFLYPLTTPDAVFSEALGNTKFRRNSARGLSTKQGDQF